MQCGAEQVKLPALRSLLQGGGETAGTGGRSPGAPGKVRVVHSRVLTLGSHLLIALHLRNPFVLPYRKNSKVLQMLTALPSTVPWISDALVFLS